MDQSNRLAAYYNDRAKSVDASDFLKQVGHTERGTSINADQFRAMTDALKHLLALAPNDRVLDLCCGNGLITKQLADDVASIVGVDFSQAMIEIARANHAAANIRYLVGDALTIGTDMPPFAGSFTKILMSGALQHIRHDQLEPLLREMCMLTSRNAVIVLGHVPDQDCQHLFYDTPERIKIARQQQQEGNDVMGNWWRRDFISKVCTSLGLECSFHSLDPKLDACRYRFDVRIC